MAQALNPKAVARRITELFFTPESVNALKLGEGDTEVAFGNLSANTAFGDIKSSVRVDVTDGMMNVRFIASSDPSFSFSFALFIDEATEERVERYLKHYLAQHEYHAEINRDVARIFGMPVDA